MKFIDICAGIGGFRSGLERAGHKCIGWVEIDKYARKSYEAMYDTTGEWTAEDITRVKPGEIPESDIWCFGFPCQDISVAGKRKGLSGERSGIFYDIIGLLKGKDTKDRPEWLLVENVKNLLSIEGGAGFTEVLSEISETGYDTEWVLLNSKNFGVPQNRERVFIVGHLRERGRRKVLSLTGTGEQTDTESEEINLKTMVKGKHQWGNVYDSYGVSKTLTSGQGGGVGNGNRTGLYAIPEYTDDPEIKTVFEGEHGGYNVQSVDGISRTVLARDYKDPQKIAVPEKGTGIVTVLNSRHYQNLVYGINGNSRAITSSDGGGLGNGLRTGLYAIPEKDNRINTYVYSRRQNERIYGIDGISRTLTSAEGGGLGNGGRTGLYAIPENTSNPKIKTLIKGNHETDDVVEIEGVSKSLKATDYKNPHKIAEPKQLIPGDQAHRVYDSEGISVTVKAEGGGLGAKSGLYTVHDVPEQTDKFGIFEYEGERYNIRRLTPRECFRLQGFTDEQFEKAQAVNSNSQLYKQAGNAVTVNVAEYLGTLINE